MVNRKTQIAIILIVIMMVTMACSAVTSTPTATPPPPPAVPTAVPQASGNCPVLPAPELTKSGLIEKVTLAKNTEGEEKNPVGETNVFGGSDIFHAVVRLVDAPDNTSFKATWYVTDVGPDVACNSTIDSTDISTSGTRNLDFTLTPQNQWPTGSYRVEIFVNNKLERVEEFSVE
jgi:hypothetical protein